MMEKELDFFIYLLERYAAAKGVTGGQMLRRLDEAGLTEFIIDMYELYHVERLENAFADIDQLLTSGPPVATGHSPRRFDATTEDSTDENDEYGY
jgi:hypothetical protein